MTLKKFFKWPTKKPLHDNISKKKLPRHIGIIMDGNGRWARDRHLPVEMGHAKGINVGWDITLEASRLGIEVLTLFTFSVENWSRGPLETKYIIDGVFREAEEKLADLQKLNVQARVIGDFSKFSKERQNRIKELQAATSQNTGLKIVLALSYSGRWDLLQAINKLINQYQNHELESMEITEAIYQPLLSLSDLPEPDLIIRTGGEQRISNFFLWQAAYSELYFTDVLWPNFNIDEFKKAIDEYALRERRFGLRED